MTKFYSKSTGGFYPEAMRADYEASGSWPADAVEITNEAHAALMVGQSQGKRIVAGADGIPELADQPIPPIADLKAAAIGKVRELRRTAFSTLAGMQSEALAKGDEATATAIVGIQQKLRDLPDIDLSKCVTQADIDGAFVAGWAAIVMSAPAAVALAFNAVLA